MAETGSVTGILEAYTTDDLKSKLNRLDSLLAAVDLRSKNPVAVFSFSNRASLNPKNFCADCGRRLRTRKAHRCQSCNMKIVGKNHLQMRERKGSA